MTEIVVTGIGAISPVGLDAATTFSALLEGRSGAGPLPFEVHERMPCRVAASAAMFDPAVILGPRAAKRNSRFALLCIAAARQAVAQAELGASGYPGDRIATIIGVGMGGVDHFHAAGCALERKGPQAVSPYALPSLIPNMAAGMISIEAGARGPSFCTASACTSSTHAIGEALMMLRSGRADVAICGGGEATIHPLALAGFAAMHALSCRTGDPSAASRPFDRDRDGFVMGEGAAVLVLERRAAAEKRGIPILGVVAGYAANSDAHHPVSPLSDGRSAAECIKLALADARIDSERVGYINAHGTSTPQNDVAETNAIKLAFGDRARRIPVSSTKSMTGHLLGGAGALEAVITLLAVKEGRIPPTINLDNADPQCDLDYVPHHAREAKLDVAVSNTFAFGGHNGVLVFTSAG